MKFLMKYIVVLSLFIVAPITLLADGEFDWITKYIAFKTTEKEIHDSKGDIQSVNKIQTGTITITQTISELKQKDKSGSMTTVSKTRTTTTTDTYLCITTVVEKELMTNSGLVRSMVASTKKTPGGHITTVQALNEHGLLETTKRTSVNKDENNITTTTIETVDKDGKLIVRQIIKSY